MEYTKPRPIESDAAVRARAWERLHGEPFDDVRAMAFHLRARAALGRALARLDAAGVDALVVKGALLAHTLYASPIERPIRDVDLRVRPGDLERAAALLAEAPNARRLVASRAYASVVLSVDKVEIDLEARVGPPFVCAIGVDAMLARAERTDAALGFAHLRPELHDHALLLAVNLFKDRFVDASGMRGEDLARLARATRFDVATLADRAREARCRTLVNVVARWMVASRADDAWGAIASRIPPARAAYAARILDAARRDPPPSSLAWRLAFRASSDARASALAAIGGAALHEIELAHDRA